MLETTQLAVVGGGVAGTSAAIEAARLGLDVTLVDEHPLDLDTMALDIPYFFGERMLKTVSDKGSMFSRIVAANHGLQKSDDAGVRVLPGTIVWDSAHNNTLTLADESRSWRLKYERAVFATGGRDVCFAFNGWQKSGVMGATGALALINRYQAFSGRRMVILGSGDLGLTLAKDAERAGVTIVGVVDVVERVRGRDELRRWLEEQDIPFFGGYTVLEALGGEDVEAVALGPINGSADVLTGSRTELMCDTVCFAIGLAANIEALYWIGCDIEMRPQQGELVPLSYGGMKTTRSDVFVAGDCAGFDEGAYGSPEVARSQGRAAAISSGESLGVLSLQQATSQLAGLKLRSGKPSTNFAYRQLWTGSVSSLNYGLQVCLCEAITVRDVERTMRRGTETPDHVKRLTRAGMGHCQGRRCREQMQMLVKDMGGVHVKETPPASYRPPFRPISLDVLQNKNLTYEEEEFVKIRWHHGPS